jgi:hypothetical protein
MRRSFIVPLACSPAYLYCCVYIERQSARGGSDGVPIKESAVQPFALFLVCF